MVLHSIAHPNFHFLREISRLVTKSVPHDPIRRRFLCLTVMNMTLMFAEGLRGTCQLYAESMGVFKLVGRILMLLIEVINVCSKNTFLQDLLCSQGLFDYILLHYWFMHEIL